MGECFRTIPAQIEDNANNVNTSRQQGNDRGDASAHCKNSLVATLWGKNNDDLIRWEKKLAKKVSKCSRLFEMLFYICHCQGWTLPKVYTVLFDTS